MIAKILNNDDLTVRGVERCKSFQWQRKFTTYGNFEMHISASCKTEIKLNDIITADNGRLCGIVKRIYFKGGDITVSGYDMKGICTQRIDTDKHSGYGGEIITQLAVAALTEDDRKIPRLRVIPSTDGKIIELEKEAKKVSEKISSICSECDLGYEIEKHGKELLFKVVVPQKREILFSERRKNISSVETENSILDSGISCVYTVSGEDISELNTGKTGYERVEATTTAQDAQEIIEESESEETITASVSGAGYLSAWDVGDWVRVSSGVLWGKEIIAEKQISEVREIYENGNISISPTFGKKQKSIIRRIIEA